MASLVLVDKDGKEKEYLSTAISIVDELELKPGEKLSWWDTFWDKPPDLPAIVEITLGKAKARMSKGSGVHTPHYDVIVESTCPKDLFKLISVCIKKFGGEVIAIDPKPREHSFVWGVRDDSRRLWSLISRTATKALQRLKFSLPG